RDGAPGVGSLVVRRLTAPLLLRAGTRRSAGPPARRVSPPTPRRAAAGARATRETIGHCPRARGRTPVFLAAGAAYLGPIRPERPDPAPQARRRSARAPRPGPCSSLMGPGSGMAALLPCAGGANGAARRGRLERPPPRGVPTRRQGCARVLGGNSGPGRRPGAGAGSGRPAAAGPRGRPVGDGRPGALPSRDAADRLRHASAESPARTAGGRTTGAVEEGECAAETGGHVTMGRLGEAGRGRGPGAATAGGASRVAGPASRASSCSSAVRRPSRPGRRRRSSKRTTGSTPHCGGGTAAGPSDADTIQAVDPAPRARTTG